MRRAILVTLVVGLAVPLWATGELRHADVGAQISKAEWEATDTHYVVDAVTGDILYVDASGYIKRLAIGTEGYMLAVDSGLPAWAESIAADASGTTFTGTAHMTSVTITETLGVGITTPTELVHIQGNENGDVSLLVVNTGNATLTQAVIAVQAGDTQAAFAAIDDSFSVAEKPNWAGHAVIYTTTETQGLTLAALSSTGSLRFITGGANFSTYERGRFDYNGRLGIGTTTPDYGLDVTGTDATAGALSLTRYQNNAYGPNLYLIKDRAGNAGQDEDYCGYLAYRTRNSSSSLVTFAEIRAMAEDVTTGSEDGRLMIHVQKAGSPTDIVTVYTTGTAITGICKADSFEGTGSGDASGPASSTDNAVARFNGIGGKTLQNSGVIVGDTNSITGVNALTASSIVVGYIKTGTYHHAGGTPLTIAPTSGRVHTILLDQETTITLDGIGIDDGNLNYIVISQPSGANYGVNWEAAVEWPATTAPTMTATNGAIDVYAFMKMPATLGAVTIAWTVAQDIR